MKVRIRNVNLRKAHAVLRGNGVSLLCFRKHFFLSSFSFLSKECDGMAYQREQKMYQTLKHQSVDSRC